MLKRLLALLLCLTLLAGTTAALAEDGVFYKPETGYCGDVTPIYANGRYYVFFLHSTLCKWCLTETTDFVNFTPYKVLQDFGGTGDVIYADGMYHLFASKESNGSQVIWHYVSTDLYNWTFARSTLPSDGQEFVTWAWRDPRVFWNEDAQEYWMLVTTNQNDGDSVNRNGCLALCASDDLYNWEYRGVFYAPGRFEGSFECPDLFKMGDWYYLVYSNASESKRTYYVKSKTLDGDWISPDVDTFDSMDFYAAKTASDGTERYLFGWSGQKTDSVLGLGSDGSLTRDEYATIGYAGNMIVHRLVQADNGDLWVAAPQTVCDSFDQRLPESFAVLSGDWETADGTYTASASGRMAAALMRQLPDSYLLTLTLKTDAKQAGIALQANGEFAQQGSYFYLDRGYNALIYLSGPRFSGGYGYYFPFDFERLRPIAVNGKTEYRFTVLHDDDLTVVYVNDRAALTVRTAAGEEGALGLWCFGGDATFSDVQLYQK